MIAEVSDIKCAAMKNDGIATDKQAISILRVDGRSVRLSNVNTNASTVTQAPLIADISDA